MYEQDTKLTIEMVLVEQGEIITVRAVLREL
jgi:hypothetical protein